MTTTDDMLLREEERHFIEEILVSDYQTDLHQGAQVIYLLHKGYSTDQVADITLLDAADIQRWAGQWRKSGLEGLIKLKIKSIESRLRYLLPADLYADLWNDSSVKTLERVFVHLRTLLKILYDYVPQHVYAQGNQLGTIHHEWEEGTLMFTDLAGFTPLMEAHTARGRSGAAVLHRVLNHYFAHMIAIITKSGGNLLEYTGDAMLAQFPTDHRQNDTPQAIRAGLRMQRAMQEFSSIETEHGTFSLGMRIGVHRGRHLVMDIGTPRRMEHVLLGQEVRATKMAESKGRVGWVCLTAATHQALHQMADRNGKSVGFEFEAADVPDYYLVKDTLSDKELGEYELSLVQSRRFRAPLLLSRSPRELVANIENVLQHAEPLASYLPSSVLKLLVENTDRRQIPPDFARPVVLFVQVTGLAEIADATYGQTDEEHALTEAFSRVFARIDAIVDHKGGTLKRATYHLSGSDIMIFFGVPNAHTDDSHRAVEAALSIRDIFTTHNSLTIADQMVSLSCRIGLSRGPVFAAEIGEPRGRREFNVLGDDVNIAARLMAYRDTANEILITKNVYDEIAGLFDCEYIGTIQLKGKSESIPIFVVQAAADPDNQS